MIARRQARSTSGVAQRRAYQFVRRVADVTFERQTLDVGRRIENVEEDEVVGAAGHRLLDIARRVAAGRGGRGAPTRRARRGVSRYSSSTASTEGSGRRRAVAVDHAAEHVAGIEVVTACRRVHKSTRARSPIAARRADKGAEISFIDRSASPSSQTKPVSTVSCPVMSTTVIRRNMRPLSQTASTSCWRSRLPRGTPPMSV